MKELFAAFAAEIFRPIITLLIPGIWAVSPWCVVAFMRWTNIWEFVKLYRTPSALVFLVLATAMGMILENLGGEIENIFFRTHGQKAFDNWYSYLRRPSQPKLIAYSYINSYTLRLKYEGGMAAGSIFAIFGTIFLPTSACLKSSFVLIEIILLVYMIYQVKTSVKELVDVREQIADLPANYN